MDFLEKSKMSQRSYEEIKEAFVQGCGGDVGSLIQGRGWYGPVLHWACMKSDWEFVVWLLLHCRADANSFTSLGNNPIFFSLRRPRILLLLIWRGSDIYLFLLMNV